MNDKLITGFVYFLTAFIIAAILVILILLKGMDTKIQFIFGNCKCSTMRTECK